MVTKTPELSADEMTFLSDVISGRCNRDFWSDAALHKLSTKLRKMADDKIYGGSYKGSN